MDSKYFIAFDLGATSGRTILGTLTGDKLTLEEVTRFPNQMLQLNGHFYWNIFSLYENLKKVVACDKAGRLTERTYLCTCCLN